MKKDKQKSDDLAIEASRLVLCSKRLPTKTGEYRILNNSACNGGDGMVIYDTEKGWDIPDMIKSFYRIIGWYEENGELNHE